MRPSAKSLANLRPAKKGEIRNPTGYNGLRAKLDFIKTTFCDNFSPEDFAEWVKKDKNKEKFYDMLVKLLPKDIDIGGELRTAELTITAEDLKKKNIGELIELFRGNVSKDNKGQSALSHRY